MFAISICFLKRQPEPQSRQLFPSWVIAQPGCQISWPRQSRTRGKQSPQAWTTIRENKPFLFYCAFQEWAHWVWQLAAPVFIRTTATRYSEGDDNILKGSSFPWVSKCGVFRKILVSICFWFVFKEKSVVSFQRRPAMDHSSGEHATLLSGQGIPEGKVYLKMNDWDRIVPSLWSSCFLIWDSFQRNILIHSSASTPVFAQR